MAWTDMDSAFLSDRTSADNASAADFNQHDRQLEELWENQKLITGVAAGTQASSDIETLYTELISENKMITIAAGGFWGDVIWKDADEIIIRVKGKDGITPFIGVVLNDSTFIESASDITVKLDTPGNSGHILDGITAILNNEWYILWGYEDSGNNLAFGFTWMPNTTFSNANPTNSLTLAQVNAQDIGLLFNPDSDLRVWESATEMETWLYNSTDGYTPGGACNVSSRTATVITLDGNLGHGTFAAASEVAQIDNFKPLAVDDGLIVDDIGSRGYVDTGVRIYSTAAGAVTEFYISHKNEFIFLPTWNSFNTATSLVIYKLTESPIDKTAILNCYAAHAANQAGFYAGPYWDTNLNNLLSLGSVWHHQINSMFSKDGLITIKNHVGDTTRVMYEMGYKI